MKRVALRSLIGAAVALCLGLVSVVPLRADQLPLDDDSDGCSNADEMGLHEAAGGRRDPTNFWDFFDVPTGTQLTRNASIAAPDIFAVIARFGDSGDPSIDPLSPPATSGYHSAYDRGVVIGPNQWNLGPANGSVAASDIFAVIAQFGHTCLGEPDVDMTAVVAACGGIVKSPEQADADRAAISVMVSDLLANHPVVTEQDAIALESEMTTLAATEAGLIEGGEQYSECVTSVDQAGQLVGFRQITTDAVEGLDTGPEPAFRDPIPRSHVTYHYCETTRRWESEPFGTDIAKMKHRKDWGYVSEVGNPYRGAIFYNLAPIKTNEIPSYFGFRFATVGNSPQPTHAWYYQPYFVQSHAQTEFNQVALSHVLESYLLVGFSRCWTW